MTLPQADHVSPGNGSEPKRAQMIDLSGKYYGTLITYRSDYGEHCVKIWINDGDAPSARQLADWGMTLDEARADGMMSDSHYEAELTYQAAMVLCEFLNGETISGKNPRELW